MARQRPRYAFFITCIIFLAIAFFRGWDGIINFIGILLKTIIPLVLGICIAFVVSIPTVFLERHFFPNSKSELIRNIRRPVCLALSAVITVSCLIVLLLVLAPAVVDTVVMARDGVRVFLRDLMTNKLFEPYQAAIQEFLDGDIMKNVDQLDIESILQGVVGGSMSDIGNHLFTFMSTIMTGFFGLLFAVILLTDTTDALGRIMNVILVYLGPKRTERLSVILGVADASFRNFIVRQLTEATILGLAAFVTLFVMGHEHALGAAALMGLCAIIPIVGYPVGLGSSALVVAISSSNLVAALIYIVCVAAVQLLEATFVLPHIGDPRTVLSPVWTTIGVTIGGGVAGFIGMLIAIPTCAMIHQLILIDMSERGARLAAEQEAEVERMIDNVRHYRELSHLAADKQGDKELQASEQKADGEGEAS